MKKKKKESLEIKNSHHRKPFENGEAQTWN